MKNHQSFLRRISHIKALKESKINCIPNKRFVFSSLFFYIIFNFVSNQSLLKHMIKKIFRYSSMSKRNQVFHTDKKALFQLIFFDKFLMNSFLLVKKINHHSLKFFLNAFQIRRMINRFLQSDFFTDLHSKVEPALAFANVLNDNKS